MVDKQDIMTQLSG